MIVGVRDRRCYFGLGWRGKECESPKTANAEDQNQENLHSKAFSFRVSNTRVKKVSLGLGFYLSPSIGSWKLDKKQ